MTQIIATLNEEAIVVATDSLASSMDPDDTGRKLTVQKLFSLGNAGFVLSAGLGIGVHLSRLLRSFVQERGISVAKDMLDLANPFLSRHYEEILSTGDVRVSDLQLDRLLFLVGGAVGRHSSGELRLIFLASEGGRVPFEQHEISNCLTVPRSMGAEMRLQQMNKDRQPAEEILKYAHEFLKTRAQHEEGVGPPFFWGLLTMNRLRMGRWTEEE